KMCVATIPVVKVSEDALTRRVSQHGSRHDRARTADVVVPQCEEKRLVFYDRTTAAHRVLVCVSPIDRRGARFPREWVAIAVVEPANGGQRRVSVVPDSGTPELVRSRTR